MKKVLLTALASLMIISAGISPVFAEDIKNSTATDSGYPNIASDAQFENLLTGDATKAPEAAYGRGAVSLELDVESQSAPTTVLPGDTERRVWNVNIDHNELRFDILQTTQGAEKTLVWDDVNHKYVKNTISPATSTIIATEKGASETGTRSAYITNHSNFDVTASASYIAESGYAGLFSASVSGEAIPSGSGTAASATLNEEVLGTILTAIPDDTLAGKMRISLTAGAIYENSGSRKAPTNLRVYTAAQYGSLDQLATEVAAGDTVRLGEDVEYDANHTVALYDPGFDLDLGGWSIYTNSGVGKELSNMGYTASALTFATYDDVEVYNGTIGTAYGAGIYLAGTGENTKLSDLNIHAAQVGTQSTREYSSAVRMTSGAHVTIESGTYKGPIALTLSNSGAYATINGGTFDGDIFISTGGTTANKVLTINGGTFLGELQNFNKGVVTIRGGAFVQDPTAYVASGYSVSYDGAYYRVIAD